MPRGAWAPWGAVLATLALLLGACALPAPAPGNAGGRDMPAGFPVDYYADVLRRGGRVLRVSPAESLLVIEVRRAGALARLGHDHVVASRDVQGYVAESEARADLYLPLDRMTVDEAELRAQSGFDTTPSAGDIEGTRRNMLGALEASRHPHAVVRVKSWSGGQAQLELTLNGVTREMTVPATIESGEGTLAISARLSLRQTDFGITPFSILGGAIQVQDAVDLRLRLYARRVGGPAGM